jgi:hypothetical protein
MCKHTNEDECQCSCHVSTETGEPAVMHMIACCEKCECCGRNIDYQIQGFVS